MVAIAAKQPSLDSKVSERFGRAPYFIVFDHDEYQIINNLSQDASSGAGVQAVQTLVSRGVTDVIAVKVGPKAERALQAAGIKLWRAEDGTVSENIDKFRLDKLAAL